MAGLMLCEVNVRDGRERAAASVLDVVVEEDWFVVVGDAGTSDPPTTPAVLCDEPCLGRVCRFNCKALREISESALLLRGVMNECAYFGEVHYLSQLPKPYGEGRKTWNIFTSRVLSRES